MHDAELHEAIQRELLAIAPLDDWPELRELIERPVAARSKPCWEYVHAACDAVGGRREDALPGAAAIFCLLASIYLVDDMLDDDPKGLYHKIGSGKAANAALAFNALAGLVVERVGLPESQRGAVHACIAKIAMDTAYGQDLDTREMSGEADYWRAVETKTPPLFGGALRIGAILGGRPEAGDFLQRIGIAFGRLVQVSDDLKDAMETPAHPDWRSRSNNLAILFAMTADHPDRQRFAHLLDQVFESSAALEEAQNLLVNCGAASFCTYHIIEAYKTARRDLAASDLPTVEPILQILDGYMVPVRGVLALTGVADVDALLADDRA